MKALVENANLPPKRVEQVLFVLTGYYDSQDRAEMKGTLGDIRHAGFSKTPNKPEATDASL